MFSYRGRTHEPNMGRGNYVFPPCSFPTFTTQWFPFIFFLYWNEKSCFLSNIHMNRTSHICIFTHIQSMIDYISKETDHESSQYSILSTAGWKKCSLFIISPLNNYLVYYLQRPILRCLILNSFYCHFNNQALLKKKLL